MIITAMRSVHTLRITCDLPRQTESEQLLLLSTKWLLEKITLVKLSAVGDTLDTDSWCGTLVGCLPYSQKFLRAKMFANFVSNGSFNHVNIIMKSLKLHCSYYLSKTMKKCLQTFSRLNKIM